jgi:hypothetical protein
VIFMGSVLSTAASVAAGSLPLLSAAKEPVLVCFKNDLLLRLMLVIPPLSN